MPGHKWSKLQHKRFVRTMRKRRNTLTTGQKIDKIIEHINNLEAQIAGARGALEGLVRSAIKWKKS
jgi:hypothetical protein